MNNQAMLSLVGHEGEIGGGTCFRLLLGAKLVTTTGEMPVMLRELSSAAAVVTGERMPSVGTDIILKRGRLETLATVAWTDGTRARLEFEDPLSGIDLLAQMNPIGPSHPGLPKSFS